MKQSLKTFIIIQVLGVATIAAAEPAPLRLVVEPGEQRHELRLALENQSDRAVVVYLDARLAQVELRGERRGLGLCRATADALPRRAAPERFIELHPGGRASEQLDLRFLCWGRRLQRLAEAQSLRLTYRARFRAGGDGHSSWTGRLGPVDATLAEPELVAEADDGSDDEPPLELRRVGPRPDVSDANAMTLTLELRGQQGDRRPVAVRHELFHFQVTTPSGRTHLCRLGPFRVHPLRDFYDRLGRRRLGFELARYCPEGVLTESGIYEILPEFHAYFDGHDVGLTAWTGVVRGDTFLARARRGGRIATVHVENNEPGVMAEGGRRDAR